jgi:EAL domain-containing protein (putative c-di-GMP-specific phosphodiesterase class I)/ActR/RegA family two-component response regulator
MLSIFDPCALRRRLLFADDLTKVHSVMTSTQPTETPPSRYGHLSVLIVDDDPFVCTMAARVFNSLGVSEVIQTHSGQEALDKVATAPKPFDVIVCDLDMPGMDGVETLRHLPQLTKEVGIIIASAADLQILRTVEELARAHGLTMLGALPKPITPQAIAHLLDKLQATGPKRGPFTQVQADRSRLEQALADNEIEPWFQPKVSLADGALKGVEALVRWRHPQLGVLTPGAFLDSLEGSGLTDQFSEHMLRHSLTQAGQWTKAGIPIGVAVNLSVSALYRLDLPELVMALIAEHALSPQQVTLEVTESGLMTDITTPFEVISRLAMKGIRLSIDDFGTGYSTIQQLVRLPFTEFKVDMSFVRGAQENQRVRIVLDSTVEMARKLSLSVVAEGIETAENWHMLAAMRCDLAQGFFIGKPMPGSEIQAWSQSWATRAAALTTERYDKSLNPNSAELKY